MNMAVLSEMGELNALRVIELLLHQGKGAQQPLRRVCEEAVSFVASLHMIVAFPTDEQIIKLCDVLYRLLLELAEDDDSRTLLKALRVLEKANRPTESLLNVLTELLGQRACPLMEMRALLLTRVRRAPASAFAVQDKVTCLYKGGKTAYPGRVTSVNGDGTYTITYDDKEVELRVPEERISLQPTSRGKKAAAQADVTVECLPDTGCDGHVQSSTAPIGVARKRKHGEPLHVCSAQNDTFAVLARRLHVDRKELERMNSALAKELAQAGRNAKIKAGVTILLPPSPSPKKIRA